MFLSVIPFPAADNRTERLVIDLGRQLKGTIALFFPHGIADEQMLAKPIAIHRRLVFCQGCEKVRRHVVEMFLHTVNPYLRHLILPCVVSEGLNGIGTVPDDGLWSGYTIKMGDIKQVSFRNTHALAIDAERMGGIEFHTGVETGEGQVVGRGDMPLTTGKQAEGEILLVCVNIRGQHIEHHAAIGLRHLGGRKTKLPAYIKQGLVGTGTRIHRGEGLGVELYSCWAVITLSEKVRITVDVYKT